MKSVGWLIISAGMVAIVLMVLGDSLLRARVEIVEQRSKADDGGNGGSTPVAIDVPPEASRPLRPSRPLAEPDLGADPRRARVLSHVVESAHYRVSSDIPGNVCQEAAALLERAWPIWRRRFDLADDYDPGPGLFPVKIYDTEDRLKAGIFRDTGFRITCLGFVSFNTFEMFAVRHSDDYEFRRILLHEGMHQFLYRLVGRRAAMCLPRWYDEGCAHESEKHVNDGERLDLFQHAGGSFTYQIDQARRCFRSGTLTVGALLSGDPGLTLVEGNARACGWAIVHFLRTRAGPRGAWFSAWERAIHSLDDRRRDALVAELGDTRDLTERLVAFLESIAPKPDSRK